MSKTKRIKNVHKYLHTPCRYDKKYREAAEGVEFLNRMGVDPGSGSRFLLCLRVKCVRLFELDVFVSCFVCFLAFNIFSFLVMLHLAQACLVILYVNAASRVF